MTSKAALLPSVNRNLNQIVDHNGYGLFAYGSRNCIYVLDMKTSPPVIVDSSVVRNAHKGKILSLSFCKSKSNLLLASIGEEMILKIWNLETASCIISLEVKESSHVVEWLYGTTNLVVFSDASGAVSKWNFNVNNLVKIKSGSDRMITVMSSNPKCQELLAVGHSVGTISILNVNNQTCIKSLKAHSMEINSLSWSLISPSTLLSTSLDHSARVWKLDEDKPVHTYYYPSTKYKDKNDDKKNFKICSTFHPENPDIIICSNVRGAFGSVQFKENAPPKFTPYSTEDSDNSSRGIFRMLPYIDVTGQNKHILLTCDPIKISLWNISDETFLSSATYIMGNIFALSVSPINQNLLAVGAGDGFLKVLNMQSEDKVSVTTIYINLRMKIMSIAWHPTEENIIAYGSDEGRVGIVDFNRKKNLYSFETHHTNSVYSLQWGPCSKVKDSKEVYFLYSCGGGNIFIHELHKSKEKAVGFETLVSLPAGLEVDHRSYSELRWKCDYSCLALGTFSGSVHLYNDKFDFLCQLSLQLKNLESLRWHPIHTYSSYSKESEYSSWLAAAGNDENIHIFDTSDVLNQRSETTIFKPTKSLVGHKKRVSALCWSSHNDEHLISGARDGTVQVWNVVTATPIVNYMWHRDRVYAVQWSVLNPDVIYSGGMDNCVRIWKISEQKQSEIPTKLHVVKCKQFKAKRKVSPEEKTTSDVLNSPKNGSAESKTDNSEISEVSEAHFTLESVKTKMKQSRGKVESLKEVKGSIFSTNLYSKEESFQNIFKLVDFLCDDSVCNAEDSKQITDKITSEELLNIGLYTDQFTVLKMLEIKGKIEETSGNKDKAACLQIMACNIIQLLTNAAEKKELTDFLVSISPSVSHKFWLNICEKYAVQLIEQEQFMKGSIYFMLCGKLYDALKILVEKGRLIDALALAKAQLPESDPFIKTILSKVSSQYSIMKQTENEAACYIALKDPLLAAKVMYCAGDSKYAYASVYICSKFNLQEAAHEYAVMCIEKCLSQNDWSTFYKIAELVESVRVYKIVVRVHEIISSQFKALKKEDGIVGKSIFGVTGSKILIWKSKTVNDSNSSFLAHIYDDLKSGGFLSEDKEILQDVHKALNSMEIMKESEITAKAHISVAVYLSQVIIALLMGDVSSATKYFVKIFPCTDNVVFIPKVICWIFFPLDLYWCSSKNSFLCEVKNLDIDMFLSAIHFQNIFNSVCVDNSDTEVFSMYPDISNLDAVVQQVLSTLSKKPSEDSFLLYFSTQYLNELRKLAKKNWRFRCYDKDVVSDTNPGVVTYVYDSQCGKWLLNSDNNINEFISMEDVLKKIEQTNFQLVEKCVTEDERPNVSSITDIVSRVFSSETDCNTKDVLVQYYGFMDVSDFLQRVMSDEKPATSQKHQQSAAELSSVNGSNCHVEKCIIDKLYSEEEDLHAQCWTDIGLFYVLTKSFFSIICKDEYALLYYLQNYLISLDSKIADLVRLQSTVNPNKTMALKVSLCSKQSEKAEDAKENNKLSNSSENNNSNSVSGDSLPKDNNVDVSKSKPDSNNILNINNEENVSLDNEKKKLLGEVNLIIENEFSEDSDNLYVESATKDENVSHLIVESSDTAGVNILKDNVDISESKPDFNNILNINNEENVSLENEKKKLLDEVNLMIENFSKDDSDNISLESAIKVENVSHLIVESSDTAGVNVLKDSASFESAVTFSNSSENGKVENKLNLQNEQDQNLKLTINQSPVEVCSYVNSGGTKDCSSNANYTEEDKIENGDNVVKQKLQAEREGIAEQIKLLQLEEFWYPDPFVSVAAVKGICCDIFRKHSCPLIKMKFHELMHEVDQWCAKYSLTKESQLCEIRKQICT